MYAKKILYLEIPHQNSFSSIGSDKTWNPILEQNSTLKKVAIQGISAIRYHLIFVLEKKVNY